MSRKSSSGNSLWLATLILIAFYGYCRFWYVPEFSKTVPMLVTVEMLGKQPERYQNHQVILLDGLVKESAFFLERSLFAVTDKNGSSPILGISPVYRPNGSKLDGTIFLFEIIFSTDNNPVFLLREVQGK